jgi:hypothetical protein
MPTNIDILINTVNLYFPGIPGEIYGANQPVSFTESALANSAAWFGKLFNDYGAVG